MNRNNSDVNFSDETSQSYVEAVEHKNTKTFTDFSKLERDLN